MPCNAGGRRFDPWLEIEMPHAEEQLSPSTATDEPTRHN